MAPSCSRLGQWSRNTWIDSLGTESARADHQAVGCSPDLAHQRAVEIAANAGRPTAKRGLPVGRRDHVDDDVRPLRWAAMTAGEGNKRRAAPRGKGEPASVDGPTAVSRGSISRSRQGLARDVS